MVVYHFCESWVHVTVVYHRSPRISQRSLGAGQHSWSVGAVPIRCRIPIIVFIGRVCDSPRSSWWEHQCCRRGIKSSQIEMIRNLTDHCLPQQWMRNCFTLQRILVDFNFIQYWVWTVEPWRGFKRKQGISIDMDQCFPWCLRDPGSVGWRHYTKPSVISV